MYPQRSYSASHRPRPVGNYFLPFFSLIALGLIAVFLFQIVVYFQDKRAAELQDKAAVTVVIGHADMKIFGFPDWTSAHTGSIVNEGDIIRTAPASRVILTLVNGSVIRLEGETELELAGLKTKDGHDEAMLALKSGDIWLKHTEQKGVKTAFTVVTKNLKASSLGTIFAVSEGARQAVHVLDGKVLVEVSVQDADTGRTRVVDTSEVLFGQEMSLGALDVTDIENRRSASYLALLSDEFRNGDWYEWNRSQDKNAGKTLTVADAVSQRETAEPSFLPPPSQLKELIPPPPALPQPPVQEITEILSAPQILTPIESERKTKEGTVIITGSVGIASAQVEVTTKISGKPESYVLRKYRPGSGKWSYVASHEYANFVPGENYFSFVAIGRDGKRSDPTALRLIYDVPAEIVDLSAPSVTSFNGSAKPETSLDSVKIEGKIGKGIYKVFVNGFPLGQYAPGSGSWVYYAKTGYGNLKAGVNSYELYGQDLAGNTTPTIKFTLTKTTEAPPALPPPPPPEPSNEPPVL